MTVHISEKDGQIERMRNLAVWGVGCPHIYRMIGEKDEKGYIKRGGVIVSMYGDVICDNESCPYIDDIGNCTDINAKCKYEKQRNDAVLHYAFADDKPVEIVLRTK